MFLAGLLLTKGLNFIEPITDALKYGAFVFAFAGFVEGASLAGEDMKAQLLNILKITMIASLAFHFSDIIQAGDKALAELHASISERQGALEQREQDAFLQQIQAQATEPSLMDVAGRLTYSVGTCLQKIGWIGYKIVYWIKDISLLLLISVSPLLIGFLAFSYTKSIGVNFLITSLTVILWNIGFAIVDALLIILGGIIMPIVAGGAVGVSSAAAVTVGPQFLIMCLMAAVLPVSMYFSVPIITGAIMRGSNVAGAAMSAFGIAKQTTSHIGMVTSAITSGVSNMMNSAHSSSAFSLPTASSPFMESSSSLKEGLNQPTSSVGPGDFASSGSSFPSGITSPDGKMIAEQSDPGTISVTDSVGRTSSRRGKISDPVTVAAAFSSHEATNT